MVVERQRYEDEPPDGLRYYTDFERCDTVLWERYFHCYDLGRDLVPVVKEFKARSHIDCFMHTYPCLPPIYRYILLHISIYRYRAHTFTYYKYS